jgi:hypothetical protein
LHIAPHDPNIYIYNPGFCIYHPGWGQLLLGRPFAAAGALSTCVLWDRMCPIPPTIFSPSSAFIAAEQGNREARSSAAMGHGGRRVASWSCGRRRALWPAGAAPAAASGCPFFSSVIESHHLLRPRGGCVSSRQRRTRGARGNASLVGGSLLLKQIGWGRLNATQFQAPCSHWKMCSRGGRRCLSCRARSHWNSDPIRTCNVTPKEC